MSKLSPELSRLGDELERAVGAVIDKPRPHRRIPRRLLIARCVLSRLPTHPEVADLKGTVEPTVDRTKHVNGGCRSLRADGRVWECFIGRAAVDEGIIGAGFLGEYAPSPGVG